MTTLGYLRGVREWAYPTRKNSAFLEKGVLTPEEFVRAGDELSFRCPTWKWEGGDPKKMKSYLPCDKQYLVTRQVPCANRVSSMENALVFDRDGGDETDESDWLISSVVKSDEKHLEDDFDIVDEDGQIVPKEEMGGGVGVGGKKSSRSADGRGAEARGVDGAEKEEEETGENNEEDDDDDEYADMADFEDDNVLEDDAVMSPADDDGGGGGDDGGGGGGDYYGNNNLMNVRTYDLSITYDKYYQTPRVWMMGYASGTRQPLTGEEMMKDVYSEYANRTVTIENHPHTSGPHASIHPCQHGKVMKTIVKNLIKSSSSSSGGDGDGDGAPPVENYLFIFLKFVSSIIPTITYDFTMDVQADTAK